MPNSYLYLDAQNRQHGPISPERFAAEGIRPDTLVWCSGMDDWTPAREVPELRTYFQASDYGSASRSGSQPPPPPPGSFANGAERTAGTGGQSSCGAGGPARQLPCPDTYIVWAILTTVCCCLPFGLVAVFKSCQVSSFYSSGRYDQALLASYDAKKWVIIAVICGIASPLLYILFSALFSFLPLALLPFCWWDIF